MSETKKIESYEIKGARKVIALEPGVRYAVIIQGCEREVAAEIAQGLEEWASNKKLIPITLVFLDTGINIEFIPMEEGTKALQGGAVQ